jgi:hypothetical protein
MPILFLTKIYDGEKTASSTNVAGKSVFFVCKRQKLDPCLSPCTSINSKSIKDLNIRPQTFKLVQERTGNTMEVIGVGKDFLNGGVQQLRKSIDKWDFI